MERNCSFNLPDGTTRLFGSSIRVYTTDTHTNLRMDNLGSGSSNCAYFAIRTDAVVVAYGRHTPTENEYTYLDANLSLLPELKYIIKY